MNNDPLNITLSLIHNLNLLEEKKEFSINTLRSLPKMDRHWMTIKKYLKIIQLIQKYCPKIELNDSKFRIKQSKIYGRFNGKERLIIYLFNEQALKKEEAVNIPDNFKNESIKESIGYLFHKTENGKYYLDKSALDDYRSINEDLTDLMFNNKEIEELFPKEDFPRYKDSADFSVGSEGITGTSFDDLTNKRFYKSSETI
ncbi:MAG: hypothetical protein ACOC44_09220 [Promethearchaeia archaeon]